MTIKSIRTTFKSNSKCRKNRIRIKTTPFSRKAKRVCPNKACGCRKESLTLSCSHSPSLRRHSHSWKRSARRSSSTNKSTLLSDSIWPETQKYRHTWLDTQALTKLASNLRTRASSRPLSSTTSSAETTANIAKINAEQWCRLKASATFEQIST